MKSGDVSKLPKWAQRHIETLEMRVKEANRKTDEALALADLQRDTERHTMIAPAKKTLYFDASCDGISVRYDKGALVIQAGWGDGLSVRPVVSNVVQVVSAR